MQFFAVSDEECWHAFGVEPKVGKPDDHEYDEEVVCTSYYSQFEPTENGEVHIRQVNENLILARLLSTVLSGYSDTL